MKREDSTVYIPNPRVAYRKIGERFVLVNIEDNNILKLNETGSEIWSCLDGRDINEVAAHVREVFDVSQEEALSDVRDFLEDMKKRGLVEQQNQE